MLEVIDISVSYGTQKIVSHLSLSVPTGTTTAIVGPSGSGKSTLLHAICGVLRLDEGRIIVDGVDITTTPAHKRHIGLVSQTGDLFPTMTVRDNIEYGLRTEKMDRAERRSRSDALLEMIGLSDLADRMPHTLSGGQARRVALARALARKPRLLLMDEPLTGLDPATHDELAADVKRLIAESQMTVVLVTHDPVEADALADRVVDLRSLMTTR
ncbi:MAG: hypothetical protein RIR69_1788 [Actinomycetota bacterium]